MNNSSRSTRTLRGAAAASVLALTAGALSACAPSDDGRTFEIWWYSDPDQVNSQMWEAALEVFQEENPDVTVEFQQTSFQQIRANGAQILQSSEAPDVMQYNQGTGDTGFIAKNGLITELNEYAEQYGWDDIIPEGGQFTAKYDERGVMGSGDWYAVPNFPIYLTVYYNKDMFAEKGLEEPTTLTEFEDVLAAFADDGVTPISLAGGEYPGWQLWYQLSLADAGREYVDDFILFEDEPDFSGPEMTSGAETFADWVARGFISDEAASIRFDDASAAFVSGQYPIIITGSWMFSGYLDLITDFDWGTFNFPGNNLYEGSGGNNWVVPIASENADLAAKFIDITLRPEMQAMLAEGGMVPITGESGAVDDPRVLEFVDQYNEIADLLAFWPDMSVPGFDPPMVNAFQSLINGSATPEEALQSIESVYVQGAQEYAE